ncbi:3D-(3,5/4)-trihydroxycyclohexane-1,2-dione acylhydrolase (decyclizing) [Anaerovibrio sp.]|uniref:3D-(3,5/4)-trihydroxycyclohexane-1,2-dione acylhydrolase (decyclizing) n=1 Tax=Anaerovibrio sp. TaxID=1872532 RepID=UPI003F14F98B
MAKTIRLTTAQALVKFLNNQHIEFDGREQPMFKGVFTIFGHGNVVGLGQALEENPGHLIVHQGRNEQGMALAAMGYAKQLRRRQIYACTSSIGPGAANMITAAACATANCIPVLFLPGDTYADRQPDPVLQQLEQPHSPGITTNDAFRAVCKYWDRITRPEILMSAAINAMRVLADPAETGAVCLALPQDTAGEAYDYPDYFFQKRVHHIDRPLPVQRAIDEAADLIRSKKKPLLIFGGGVRYSEAENAFLKFAEGHNIPFGETQAGKGTVDWRHPLNMCGIGETGCLAANRLAREADVIIGVGTRYTDFTTSSKWLYQNPDVEFININISRFHACKLDGLPIVADARAALEALDLALGDYRSAYTDEITRAKADYTAECDRLAQVAYTGRGFVPEIADAMATDRAFEEFISLTGSALTQTQVMGILREMMDDNAIIVGAAGSLPGDLQRYWRPKSTDSYHVEYGFSCMGYEVNAALGVKLAAPEREVYAATGDGSFMMLHSELAASIQENKKINVILLDNMAFGCINNLEIGHGQGSFGTEFRFRSEASGRLDGSLVPVNFAKIAEGYGCKAYSARNADELRSAIEDAKKQQVSTLIDIKVLPKTMAHGYDSWWRVGVAAVSENPKIQDCYRRGITPNLAKARKY